MLESERSGLKPLCVLALMIPGLKAGVTEEQLRPATLAASHATSAKKFLGSSFTPGLKAGVDEEQRNHLL
ncbi:MAG: hypothetical protein KJ578_12450 [Bacteroidetes bacterium]|nr:hypothetical protein [Bacteroidota bacterium]MBU1579704.1 hypothetical protein [Bacteroidota bacterium]MBU2558581.1 hypothetical protein [Bacteroidota bacterium]